MDYLAETYLKYQTVHIEELIGPKGKNQLSMRNVPVEQIAEYAAEDADITLKLKNYFAPELKKEGLGIPLHHDRDAINMYSYVRLSIDRCTARTSEHHRCS